jgi:hypothetical protein
MVVVVIVCVFVGVGGRVVVGEVSGGEVKVVVLERSVTLKERGAL